MKYNLHFTPQSCCCRWRFSLMLYKVCSAPRAEQPFATVQVVTTTGYFRNKLLPTCYTRISSHDPLLVARLISPYVDRHGVPRYAIGMKYMDIGVSLWIAYAHGSTKYPISKVCEGGGVLLSHRPNDRDPPLGMCGPGSGPV
jgi:hypothetical protein